jgi:hypothetical protein
VNSPVVISKPVFETDELNIAINEILSKRIIETGSKANFDRQDCSMRGKSSVSSSNTFFEAQFSMVSFD